MKPAHSQDIITSRSNPKIKQVRSLRRSRRGQESSRIVVEGIWHVGEALAAASSPDNRFSVESIFYAPDLLTSDFAAGLVRQQSALGVPVYSTSPEVFESMVGKDNPQGILAVVQYESVALSQVNPQNFPWGVALVSPQDPGNIGAIMRTIDAVGASGLLLLEGSADPFHARSVRASMGALFWRPVINASFAEFTGWAKTHRYRVYGTSAHADKDYREVSHYQAPLILLMGSEREGLTTDQATICDELLRLPMHGRVTSLNLAVATGVMLYKILE